jgi:hypothetical protein
VIEGHGATSRKFEVEMSDWESDDSKSKEKSKKVVVRTKAAFVVGRWKEWMARKFAAARVKERMKVRADARPPACDVEGPSNGN